MQRLDVIAFPKVIKHPLSKKNSIGIHINQSLFDFIKRKAKDSEKKVRVDV
jgi:hypothetical protein